MRTPIQPRLAAPNWRNCCSTSRAQLDGMAKPMPTLPPLGEKIAELMPMTLPSMSNSGPPELPLLMGASVWMKSS